MGWNGFPIVPGSDVGAYEIFVQFWQACRERAWAQQALTWPRTSFVWASGVIDAPATDNLDGTYTVTHTSDGTAAGRWAGYSGHSPTPVNYDLIIDDDDWTRVIHVRIYASTATSLTIDSTADHIIPDLATGGFLDPDYTIANVLSSLWGKTYHIIQRGGIWWNERWPQWPNDHESYQGLALTAGANQIITNLTSIGTTATAVCAGHQLVAGDTVTIAGAISSGNHYNGSFTVATTPDLNTFTYTITADSSPATGAPTVHHPNVGARDAGAAFPLGLYGSGYVLLAWGSDGVLHRLALTGGDATNLYWVRQFYTISGQYAVQRQYNFLGSPHRSRYRRYSDLNGLAGNNDISIDTNPLPGRIMRWYHSAWSFYKTRLPDGTIGSTRYPKTSTHFADGGGGVDVPTFDQDVWTDVSDTFNPPDRCYTADLFRTIRSIQKTIEDWCAETEVSPGGPADGGGVPVSNFVLPVSHTGSGADDIYPITRAELFKHIGADNQSGTTGSLNDTGGVGGIDVSAMTFPRYPVDVFYVIYNTDGGIRRAGAGNLDTATHLNRNAGKFNSDDTGGKTVVISRGWTRHLPRTFMYWYSKKCWVASVSGGVTIDPPTSTHAGIWTTRGPSTNFREPNPIGIVNDANMVEPITDGVYARYLGDNYNDPTIHPETDGSDTTGIAAYLANFYEGYLDPVRHAARVAMRAGTVTGSTRFYIEDTAKDFWGGVAPLVTITGTFDGGDAQHGSDSSKTGDQRWLFSNMGGQIVEVSNDGGATFAYPRYIFNYFNDYSLPWSPTSVYDLPFSANGKAYRVRWPKYESNTWANHSLVLTYPGGTQETVNITANDDKRIYFSALAAAPPVGTTYQIEEQYPGGVWLRQSGQWVIPTGNDTRLGSPVPWRSNQRENLPTIHTEYGRFMKNDYFAPVLNEIHDALNALVHLWSPYDWQGDAYNYRYGLNTGNTVFEDGSTGAKDRAIADFTGSASNSNDNPFAVAYADFNCTCYQYGVGRRYAYGNFTLSVTRQACEIDFYVWCRVANDVASGGSGEAPAAGCPAGYTFDQEGDGVLYQQWYLWNTTGPTSSGSPTSGTPLGGTTTPGSGALPAAVAAPAPPGCPSPDDCFEYKGWVARKWKAVRRYNVAGGFDKQ